MDSVGDRFPGYEVCRLPESRNEVVPATGGGGVGSFRDEEGAWDAGALGVVGFCDWELGVMLVWESMLVCIWRAWIDTDRHGSE
jgi:hypothetical protein